MKNIDPKYVINIDEDLAHLIKLNPNFFTDFRRLVLAYRTGMSWKTTEKYTKESDYDKTTFRCV